MKRTIVWGSLVLAWLVGCSQEAPTPRKKSAQPIKAATIADGVAFAVQPDSLRICDAATGAATVTASWDVKKIRRLGVEIYVIGADGQRKLWLKGGASGESTTGAWVFPETRFVLVDGGNGRQLADITVQGVACT